MPKISRRTMLGMSGLAAASAYAPRLRAQVSPGDEVIRLWPGAPPGGGGANNRLKVVENSKDPARPDRFLTGIATPMMVVKRPARPDGSAVLLMPGGGYGFEAYDNEGTRQAAWLNARGVTAFILMYRLPAEGWRDRSDAPLQDAQRAMRLIRARAGRLGVNGNRIAVLGFSAGGHLAGSLATRHGDTVYDPVDKSDAQPARPDLAGLLYPVVSLCAPYTHGGSRDALLGQDTDRALCERYSVDRSVDVSTPPVFLVHASDDDVVPIENSLMMHRAMLDARRPVEMHLFDQGGHGFGVNLAKNIPASAWPDLFSAYARRKGIFA